MHSAHIYIIPKKFTLDYKHLLKDYISISLAVINPIAYVSDVSRGQRQTHTQTHIYIQIYI